MTTIPTTHGERAHAWASPSKLHRVMACPASCQLEDMSPDPGPSPYAAEGTALHEAAEGYLRSWRAPAGGTPHAVKLESYLAHVWTAAGGEGGAALGHQLLVETRVDIAGPECFGTIDAAIVRALDAELEVVDLKTGADPVDPKENPQLMAYACGLLRAHAGAKPAAWTGWAVRLTIVQEAALDGLPPVRSWDTTGEDCAAFYKRLKAAIRASLKPNPPAVAGPHCKYCRAAAQCPARLAQVAAVFPVEPAGSTVAGAQIAAPPAPDTLAPEVLSRILGVADAIEDWLAACRAHARAFGAPGWKLVAGRAGRRDWADAGAAADALLAAGLDPYIRKVKSPTQVEGEVGKPAYATTFAPLAVQGRCQPSLVPDSDPRPALTAGDAFPAEPPA